VQSGAAIRLRERDRATRLTGAVLTVLGLTGSDLRKLQSLPMTQLLAAVEPAQKALGAASQPLFDRYPFGPVVDGSIVPRHPFDTSAPDVSADIPLLIGDMKDEMASFLARDDKVWHRTLTEQELRDRVTAVAGEHADRVIDAYRRLYPNANPAERLIATLTDANFRIRSLIVAGHKARQAGAPAYMYSFEWETPVQGGRLRAPHALDVPFTFDTIDLTNATDRSIAAHKLAATMSATWAAFARAGVPDNAAIPRWPAYDLTNRPTLVLDADCRIENDLRGETRQLWQTITGR
jgi:para-nitrobenzyl esterase